MNLTQPDPQPVQPDLLNPAATPAPSRPLKTLTRVRPLPLALLLLAALAAGTATYLKTRPANTPAPLTTLAPLPVSVPATPTQIPTSKTAKPQPTTKPKSGPLAKPTGPTSTTAAALTPKHLATVNPYDVNPTVPDPFVAPKDKAVLPPTSNTAAPGLSTLPPLPAASTAAPAPPTPPRQTPPTAQRTVPAPPITALAPRPITPIPTFTALPALPHNTPTASPLPIPIPQPPKIQIRPLPRVNAATQTAPRLVLTPPSAATPVPPAPRQLSTPAPLQLAPVAPTDTSTPTAPSPAVPLNAAQQWVNDNTVTYAGRADGQTSIAILNTSSGPVYADLNATIPGTEVRVTHATPTSVDLTLGTSTTTLNLNSPQP